MLKHSAFIFLKDRQKRGGKKNTGRKREERKQSALQATQASLPCQSEEKRVEKEKQAGQGPAVGPDPYGAAGSGMNSEWSGWAAGICLQAFVNRMTKDKRELCRWPSL